MFWLLRVFVMQPGKLRDISSVKLSLHRQSIQSEVLSHTYLFRQTDRQQQSEKQATNERRNKID
jgi:hypothetical protein